MGSHIHIYPWTDSQQLLPKVSASAPPPAPPCADPCFRWTRELDPALKMGNWTEQEVAILRSGAAKHGRQWVMIAKDLPGRHVWDIQTKYDSLHKADPFRAPWTLEEDESLRAAVGKHSTKEWNAVAKDVGQRSADECNIRWKKLSKDSLKDSVQWTAKVSSICCCCLLLVWLTACAPGGHPADQRSAGLRSQ